MNISLADWIAVAVGVVGLLSALLGKLAPKLPSSVQKIISKLGRDQIIEIIIWCETHVATVEQRRETAAQMIQDAWTKLAGVPLPDSVVNLIIEWAVQEYKKKVKK